MSKKPHKERPIMLLLDSLGRRWSLRIIWELQDGPAKFRALRSACDGVSPSVLNKRISELRKLGFVEKTDGGYGLTRDGESLAERLRKLDRWARRWDKRRQG
ncbi:MAG: helix-turn-helix transcriptional regulator [Deltaproteobacteria bacterium]|nr:helix-turn-helix transcriptional regulator [Deltaproteobacteria bacterium]NND27349.1 helix-turn-helix transcriptional regulator [Myxococcales bacterium]MBT8466578.1 helix-turn-helix transcriptional regulator [Deltaproteobacteria bacterium]MBT8480654.1 helix-turn-helix transcriptional regulator [Deltaproteobacteria bacterium]NNK05879.1 helix-turn-helix transcriptional regulator [Myxococcales bacterium]